MTQHQTTQQHTTQQIAKQHNLTWPAPSKRALDWANIYGYDFHEDLATTREPAGVYSTEVYAARAEQVIRWTQDA